jgi:hypothetical protein
MGPGLSFDVKMCLDKMIPFLFFSFLFSLFASAVLMGVFSFLVPFFLYSILFYGLWLELTVSFSSSLLSFAWI